MALLIGAFFQMFHFTFSFRGSVIEIVPEWIGWLLIWEGIDWIYLSHKTLRDRNRRLGPWFCALIGITGIRFLLGIFGFIGYSDFEWYTLLNRFLTMIPAVMGIFVWVQMIRDFLLLEKEEELPINGENTEKAYEILLVLLMITLILGITPLADSWIYKIAFLLQVIAGVNFLGEIHWLCKGLQGDYTP